MEKVIIYTDGGSRGNPGNAGVGVVISDAKGNVLKKVAKPIGLNTNNFAEYEAVITALVELKKLYGKKVSEMEFEFRLDSELVQKQLSGEYQVKEESLFGQFIKVSNSRVKDFPNISFNHIMREENSLADGLANEAMDQSE
jgi:ribonuclease HI